MHSLPSDTPAASSAENGAAETSAENGAGAFSLSSGVTTAAREVARGENLAEARFRRALGPQMIEPDSTTAERSRRSRLLTSAIGLFSSPP